MLKENLNKISRKQKVVLVGLFVGLLVLWFIFGFTAARELNENGVVSVAVVSSSDNNNVVYWYSHEEYVYEGVYSFSPNYHIPRDVGELIYVMFNPNDPGLASFAIHKTMKVPESLEFGDVVDSVQKVKVNWWYLGYPFRSANVVPYSQFRYPREK